MHRTPIGIIAGEHVADLNSKTSEFEIAEAKSFFSKAFFATILCLTIPVALSQAANYWQVADGIAHTTITFPEARKPNTHATLTIEYSIVASKCRVMVGIALLSGLGYESMMSTGKAEGLMKVTITGMRAWSAKPAFVLYSNGFEAAIPASEQFVGDLKSGNIVRVQAKPNSPIFEFSLVGSAAAIESASSVCQ